MAVLRERPYSSQNFLVDMGTGDTSGVEAGFSEVIFPDARVQVGEYRSGNERENNKRKITLTTEYGNLILKRGAIGSLSLYDWWNAVRNGDQGSLRNIRVHLLSEDLTQTVLTWKFTNARIVSITYSPLNACAPDVLTEIVELAFERMEME